MLCNITMQVFLDADLGIVSNSTLLKSTTLARYQLKFT